MTNLRHPLGVQDSIFVISSDGNRSKPEQLVVETRKNNRFHSHSHSSQAISIFLGSKMTPKFGYSITKVKTASLEQEVLKFSSSECEL